MERWCDGSAGKPWRWSTGRIHTYGCSICHDNRCCRLVEEKDVSIDLKRWFLIISVCVMGWISGFAIYWMIAPKVLPIINTQINQQSTGEAGQESMQESLQKPGMGNYPARVKLQEAVYHTLTSSSSKPRNYSL
jgi:hypothetical protein